MSLQFAPADDLSLQQVLENGLTVLRSPTVDNGKRARTLESLVRIFAEAGSASQALHAQNLLFGVEQQPALERYSIFFRYLHDYFGDNLTDRLQEASIVLVKLRDRGNPDDGSRIRTQELIERLLFAFDEERSLSPLEPPRTFNSLS